MSTEAPLERAYALLEEGDVDAAIALLDGGVRAAEGQAPAALARALNDKGQLLRFLGDDEGAAEAFARAVGLTEDDEEHRREHLTFLLNLGDVLARSGSLKDAEDAIRRSLQGRHALYGPAHAGYAFALEPLASVLLQQRKLDLALEAIDEAVASFRHHGHPRLATALAVRAEVLAVAGADTQTLAQASELPDELLAALAQTVHARAALGEPRVLLRVLYELAALLQARLGDADEVTLATWSTIANLEAHGGTPAKRREAIERVLGALDAAGDGYGALEACLGLALAYADERDGVRAKEAYDNAEARARALGDDGALAQVQRNLGVFLEDAGHPEAAIGALEDAVQAASRVGDPRLLGRCEAALGVVLAHERSSRARIVLARALTHLDEDHADALVARAHIEAFESGGACGCGEMDVALAQALREMVKARVPGSLVGDVALINDEDSEGLALDVRLTREPSPQEQQLLDEVIREAHRRLRERVLRGG